MHCVHVYTCNSGAACGVLSSRMLQGLVLCTDAPPTCVPSYVWVEHLGTQDYARHVFQQYFVVSPR